MTRTLDALAQSLSFVSQETEGGTYGPIEVFRVGSFQSMDGTKSEISLDDLEAIARSYDPENHPAPVVIGHPNTDAPAYGWIERFWVEGEILKATIRDAAPEFVEMVKAGRYKRVSISLFTPGSNGNPAPGDYYARHLGFLGAAAPAVSGLKPVKFAGDDASCFSISQEYTAPPTPQQIELAELRRTKLDLQVEDLINQGRVLPVFKEQVISFALCLTSGETVSFADGSEKPAQEWFFDYLSKQPAVVSYGALDLPPSLDELDYRGPQAGISVPNGFSVDPSQSDLAARAHRVSRQNDVSFAAALDMILTGEA